MSRTSFGEMGWTDLEIEGHSPRSSYTATTASALLKVMPVALVYLIIIAGVSHVDLGSLGASSVASHLLLTDAYSIHFHSLCASGPLIALAFLLYRRLTSRILAPYALADRNDATYKPSLCLAWTFAE